MKKSENLLLYGLLFIIIIALIFSISTFFSKGYSQQDYNKFVSAEGENKCETPQVIQTKNGENTCLITRIDIENA